MALFHVHVYRVTGLCELQVEAEDNVAAMQSALKEVASESPKIVFGESDCEYLTVIPELSKVEMTEKPKELLN